MFDNAPASSPFSQFDANGRAAAIAADLERAAQGIDTAFYAARAFSAIDNAAYTGPISAASAERLLRALDQVRPHVLEIGNSPGHHIFVLAAIEGARHRVNFWSQPNRRSYPDKSGSVAADLVRWLAKSCDMACCFLDIRGKASFPAAELPDLNVRAAPIKRQRK